MPTPVDSKKGNLHVQFIPNAKAGGVCISVGFASPNSNWFVLNKLKRGEPCGCPSLSHGSEDTALAYAIYQNVCDKLLSDIKAQQASKVSGIACNLQNGEFTIYVKAAGNVSGIRKVLSVVEQSLTPDKLYQAYSANIKLLNASPHREEFNACVNDMHKHLKNIVAVVIGKVNMDKEKLTDIVDKATAKFNAGHALSPAKKPESLSFAKHNTDYPVIKSKGMMATVVADYITSATHERAVVKDGSVIVYKLEWTSKNINDAHRIDNWANAKFGKSQELKSALVYLACVNAEINPSAVVSFMKESIDVKKLALSVKEALK